MGDFQLIDVTLRRCYTCKLFAFNTCIIYTECKGNEQLLRGTFALPDVCFVAKQKSFLLCNKQHECEFLCPLALLKKWESIVHRLLEQCVSMAIGDVDKDTKLYADDTSGQQQVAQRKSINRTIWYTM